MDTQSIPPHGLPLTIQDSPVITSRNRANLIAALRNVHRDSVAGALREAFGATGASMVAYDVARVVEGGK